MIRKFSIVIPCLNEEAAVDRVLSDIYEIRAQLREIEIPELEVIVVDDCSQDRSREKLTAWVKSHSLILLVNSERQNYGNSLKRGFAAASGDAIGFMDLDGTYDPAEFQRLLKILRGHESALVCGDRLSRLSEMPFTRKFGNQLFVGVINFLFGQNIQDSTTGQRVFRRIDLPRYLRLESGSLNFSLSMTLDCLISRRTLIEMPIHYEARIGDSKLSIWTDGPRFLFTILGGYLKSLRTQTSVISAEPSE